jgi:hypothetical protein
MAAGAAEPGESPPLFSHILEMRALDDANEERFSDRTGSPRKSSHTRKHAGWTLEFALMFALALLLPRPRKRK